jgi:hypothetical protein
VRHATREDAVAPPLSRFEYERALLSDTGPASSTARLVLLVIASHVRRRGSAECWPSIRTLEAETRLSGRCVIDTINEATAAGWIAKREDQVHEMRRRGSVYTLRLPATLTAERGSTLDHGRPLNEVQRSSAPTVERHSSRPLNVTQPLISSKEERKKEPLKFEGNGARQETNLDTWAASNGITRSGGESNEAFRRRAGDAYIKSRSAERQA